MTQAGGSGTGTPGPKNGQEGTHLNTLMNNNTEFPVIQENGQRKCGPSPDWEGPPPSKGSEVFVGKIPRDLFEDALIPIFKTVGKIYELRLMMDFEGNNRGYAFVTYSNPEEAKQAIKELDNYEIRKNRFIGVCKSVDNCRLFVGGIPKTKTKEEILLEMKKYTDAVSDVILYSSIADKSKNRGFAFVEYENHKAAAVARRKLMPGKIQLFGNDVAVDWAEPELEVDEDTMAKVTVLYVRNLMPHTTEDTIKDTFSMDDKFKIDKVKKLRDFAFIHYRNREDAETALEELSGSVLEGAQIEVTWAKPVDKAFRPRSRCLPAHSAVSVYNPYLIGLESFSGHIPFPPPLQMRPPAMPRMPFVRRGRGAAGIRRFRNYPSSNRPMAFKPLEMPVSSVPSPYSSYPQAKLSRIPEEGKPYHAHEYNMYIPAQSSSDESSLQTVSGPALAPYPGHARIAHHGYIPLPGYDDSTYYTFVTTAHPPPGTIPMY